MSKEFVEHLNGLLKMLAEAVPAGVAVDCRRFFSGAAAYADDRIFMSLTPVGLAVKLSEADRDALIRAGGSPLRYFPKAPVKKAYVVAPLEMAKDPDALRPWVARSLSYVLSLPAPARKKKRK